MLRNQQPRTGQFCNSLNIGVGGDGSRRRWSCLRRNFHLENIENKHSYIESLIFLHLAFKKSGLYAKKKACPIWTLFNTVFICINCKLHFTLKKKAWL